MKPPDRGETGTSAVTCLEHGRCIHEVDHRARGYLVTGAAQDEILRAILAVAGGEAIFGPVVASRLLDYFFREPPTPHRRPPTEPEQSC